jgi:hypothetical protein
MVGSVEGASVGDPVGTGDMVGTRDVVGTVAGTAVGLLQSITMLSNTAPQLSQSAPMYTYTCDAPRSSAILKIPQMSSSKYTVVLVVVMATVYVV